MQNPTVVSHPLVIAETPIRQDSEGRYCLNDLHRASGGEKKHGPSYWLENNQTAALIEELSDTGIPVSVLKGGTVQGTYVCKELVYSYAMWISAAFHLKVIRAYDALVTGQIQPAPVATAIAPAKEYRALYGIARLIGMEKNHAAFSANTAVEKMTGVNIMGLLGTTHLVAENPVQHFNVTELGSRLGISAQLLNRKLKEAGLQESKNGHWCATDKGMEYAVLLDTTKRHSNGTPILQLRWRENVLPALGGAA